LTQEPLNSPHTYTVLIVVKSPAVHKQLFMIEHVVMMMMMITR
jgi:hypothetical protein